MNEMATARSPFQRVLFAGGGTGGHVYMAVAIREELHKLYPTDCLFVGTRKGLEMKILPPLEFPLETIRIGGIQNLPMTKKVTAVGQLPVSLWRSRQILRKFRPEIVVGLGGYASGPVLAAARIGKVPSIVIEPNVVPGLTNRLVGRWVRGAAVAFEETLLAFPGQTRRTGIPIRQEFHQLPESQPLEGPLRVLVFGGSRGSRPLNRLLIEALPQLGECAVEICHQTGADDFKTVETAYREAGLRCEVCAYIEDMPRRFAWANLIVSRSGASTVAEVTAAGRASILVPFPHAADDHQTRNAEALARRGAAILAPQSELTGARLAGHILEFERDRSLLLEMGRASKRLAQPDSSRLIVELMQEVVD